MLSDMLREVSAAREGRSPPVLLATVIAAPDSGEAAAGAKLLVREDGSAVGSLGGGSLEEAVLREAPAAFRRHGVDAAYYAPDGSSLTRREAESRPSYQVMLELHERPATLVIAGGGHVGKALAAIAHLCGFVVVVVDERPEYASKERFPEADRVVCGRFEEALAQIEINGSTYIVTVTRGHRQDETVLRAVVESAAAYVGMIGSKRRSAAVLQHLRDEGLDAEAVARVHAPIGLDIGAETPEEIAVSIMAEVIRVRRGKGTGRPMREVRGGKAGAS